MSNDPAVKAAAAKFRLGIDIGFSDEDAFLEALKVYLKEADCGLVAKSALKNYR